jgi:hypothetical protein
MGGCMAIPTSCSNGFKSSPSIGVGKRIKNGLEAKIKYSKKRLRIKNCTLITSVLAENFDRILNAMVTRLNIQIYNNSEPSWLPQVPDTLYIKGVSECEFSYTFFIEKSFTK